MRVTLVNMPWASLDTPSLALGILHSIGRSHRADVETVNANLDFYDWAAEAIGLRVEDYEFFASHAYFEGYGDWVFSSALHGVPAWRVSEFEDQMASGLGPHLRAVCLALHEASARFVEELAVKIADTRPDLVGFTTTFQQNTAALATAAAVKRLSPGTATVLGGANCDGPQGRLCTATSRPWTTWCAARPSGRSPCCSTRSAARWSRRRSRGCAGAGTTARTGRTRCPGSRSRRAS